VPGRIAAPQNPMPESTRGAHIRYFTSTSDGDLTQGCEDHAYTCSRNRLRLSNLGHRIRNGRVAYAAPLALDHTPDFCGIRSPSEKARLAPSQVMWRTADEPLETSPSSGYDMRRLPAAL
jgi:hypothetical protein